MIGVVVATHGRLAEELIRTAEGIVGPLDRCEAISIGSNQSMEDCKARLEEAVRRVDEGQGVLVLTDMFGGTPANLALMLLDERLEVVTGVNLPMLIKVASARSSGLPLAEAAQLVTNHAQKNISVASEVLRARARPRT
ncbi:MAG: PTS sugar transporter subunit IIA [Anaeromyxobacteraceae bacterium]